MSSMRAYEAANRTGADLNAVAEVTTSIYKASTALSDSVQAYDDNLSKAKSLSATIADTMANTVMNDPQTILQKRFDIEQQRRFEQITQQAEKAAPK